VGGSHKESLTPGISVAPVGTVGVHRVRRRRISRPCQRPRTPHQTQNRQHLSISHVLLGLGWIRHVVSELPKEKGNEENADLPGLHQKASGGIRQIGIANSERNVGRMGAGPRRLSGVVGDGGARSGRGTVGAGAIKKRQSFPALLSLSFIYLRAKKRHRAAFVNSSLSND